MKCSDIIKELRKLAPEELACEWDNVGLLLGRGDKNISTILIALEVTEDVLEMAIRIGADMLVTHHPLVFHPLKKVNSENAVGRWMMKLLRNDIACYAMHTNYDRAPRGMGELAAYLLGLHECRFLGDITAFEGEDGSEQAGLGRIGELLVPMNAGELCRLVNRAFENDGIRVYLPENKAEAKFTQIAVLPGSGGDYVDLALESGAEVLITGDVSHHEGTDAVSKGMVVLDPGHYSLEFPFVDQIEKYLSERISADINIVTVPYQPPFTLYREE